MLGLGLAALGWGLVTLQRMFAEETEQSREQLRGRQRLLDLEATTAVRLQFKARLAVAVERAGLARADPLEPTHDVYLVRNDIQIFPISLRPAAVSDPTIKGLYDEQLSAGPVDEPVALQRQLLRDADRLSRVDFDSIASRLIELSNRQAAPVDRFNAILREFEMGAPMLPHRVSRSTLLNQTWYLERLFNGEVRGCEAPLEQVLKEVASKLREEEALAPEDHLTAAVDPAQPISALFVKVDAPSITRAEAELARRYGLKNSMIVICGLFALALTVFGILGQHRKQRFLELKSDFVATVSHELRTPLASIRLLAETLDRSSHGAVDETIKQFPSRIVRVADGLHFLVENILSFNQVTKGRWVIEPKPLRLDEIIDDLRNDLTDASSKPIQIALQGGELQLIADPALVRLLFINLGRNACAYNQQAHVEISVAGERDAQKNVTLRFSDNGIGIPGNEWDNVFHDFYRLKSTGTEVHGSGLGLALCRKIVALHGGTIVIERSGSQGTTFALTFKTPITSRATS